MVALTECQTNHRSGPEHGVWKHGEAGFAGGANQSGGYRLGKIDAALAKLAPYKMTTTGIPTAYVTGFLNNRKGSEGGASVRSVERVRDRYRRA